MIAFEVPNPPITDRDFPAEYALLLRKVNPVNHGEFEDAATQVLQEASVDDAEGGPRRARMIAIQRCRRGGKTFMLHAVAAKLASDLALLGNPTRIIFISMNSNTGYLPREDAYQAILSRVAWEISGREYGSFLYFQHKYNDYGEVDSWMMNPKNHAILIVDELNIIPHTANDYSDMSAFLDNFMQKKGCAILYSTHQRNTADLLRGCHASNGDSRNLSKRFHKWVSIPRLHGEMCLRGLEKVPSEQPTFWSAVLHGRVPSLVLLDAEDTRDYAYGVFHDESNLEHERQACLAAVITGKIDHQLNERNLFKAYSYMSERFQGIVGAQDNQALFAWPAFMVAQRAVLGKDYPFFRATLENPGIDKAKAFEAVVQLVVLVRLLSDQQHPLVPSNSAIRAAAGTSAFEATEMFHVDGTVTMLEGIVSAVGAQFSGSPKVVQVVAVPMCESFPTYDFFLLHKAEDAWTVAAGYQCKLGMENPRDDAWNSVPTSVWVEGNCREYRVPNDGKYVSKEMQRGWVLLGESTQLEFLGVSMSEALPQAVCEPNPLCLAETSCQHREETGAGLKRARLD